MRLTYRDMTIAADAQVTLTELDSLCLQMDCAWEGESVPTLEITWSMPIADFHYLWHPRCGKDRRLPPDWRCSVYNRVSSGAPVMCFYNLEGQNRMTVSLSDALSETCFSFGVNEESAKMICRISIPMDGHNGAYSVVLRRDCDPCRYEEALRRVSAWWEGFYPPMAVPDIARDPLYSTWYSYHQRTIDSELEAECAQAAQDGFGCVIVDDGWQTLDNQRGYAYCGDWEALKIPNMRAHVDRVHALGMKYILWYSVPFMGQYAKACKQFEGKTLGWRESHGAYVLDPRYPEVRKYLTGVYEKAMREWDLDGFKLDFIDSFCATREAPPYAPGMDCRTVEEAVVRLMVGVKDALQNIKPDALIEFRQSYIGPAMRLYGNMFRVGDCPNDFISNRVGMVDLRLLMGESAVHSDMLMWHPEETVENAAVQIENILFSVPQISVRLAELPAKHRKMLGFWMDFIRRHRALLAAPIEAEAPQMLYPLVRTRLGDESAVGVYQAGFAAKLEKVPTTYLVNAADSSGVVAELPAAVQASVYDCMGEKQFEQELPAGLCRIAIPLGGYAHVEMKK